GTAFDNPARQSFVSEVAGPAHLPNAIGLNSATFHAARIVGPAVAGLVIAALRLINGKQLTIIPPAVRAKRQIREGLSYVRQHREILLVLWVVGFVGT